MPFKLHVKTHGDYGHGLRADHLNIVSIPIVYL